MLTCGRDMGASGMRGNGDAAPGSKDWAILSGPSSQTSQWCSVLLVKLLVEQSPSSGHGSSGQMLVGYGGAVFARREV